MLPFRSFRKVILSLACVWVSICLPLVAIAKDFMEQGARVVSLSPYLTEAINALDGNSFLVGQTIYCRDLDSQKKVRSVGGIDVPNIELILSLKPTLVMASNLTTEETLSRLERFGVTVERFNTTSLEDILTVYKRVGHLLGKQTKANDAVTTFREALTNAEALKRTNPSKRPKACFLFGFEAPIFSAGKKTYVSELIELAGFTNIANHAKSPWPQLNNEWLIEADPEVIFITQRKSSESLEQLVKRLQRTLPWSHIAAVQAARVYEIPEGVFANPSAQTLRALPFLSKVWLAYP